MLDVVNNIETVRQYKALYCMHLQGGCNGVHVRILGVLRRRTRLLEAVHRRTVRLQGALCPDGPLADSLLRRASAAMHKMWR